MGERICQHCRHSETGIPANAMTALQATRHGLLCLLQQPLGKNVPLYKSVQSGDSCARFESRDSNATGGGHG